MAKFQNLHNFIFMHEITVHHFFHTVFMHFLLKMGWKWEILSHCYFWPKHFHSLINPPQGFQKRHKWIKNLNLFNQTWKFAKVKSMERRLMTIANAKLKSNFGKDCHTWHLLFFFKILTKYKFERNNFTAYRKKLFDYTVVI